MIGTPDVEVEKVPGWQIHCRSCDLVWYATSRQQANRLKARHRKDRLTKCAAFVKCSECGCAAVHHDITRHGTCAGEGYDPDIRAFVCECQRSRHEAMQPIEPREAREDQ